MNEAINSRMCDRAEDLISFLYGELGETEARGFEQHVRNCETCEVELAGFGAARESVVAWRDQTIGRASLTPLTANVASSPLRARPSALAAIRGFFELSPLWMKGITAFATVLFCVLAGLAVFRSTTKTSSAPTLDPAQTAMGIDAEVKRRVEAELAAMKKNENERSENVIHETPVPKNVDTASRNVRVGKQLPQKLRKPLTRAEREQLAADLRLVSGEDEDSLELIGDRINNE